MGIPGFRGTVKSRLPASPQADNNALSSRFRRKLCARFTAGSGAFVMRPIILVATLIVLATSSAHAQKPAAPPAQAAPYKPVAVTLPTDLNDPAFTTFRKQLAEAANKRDAAAVAKFVVSAGF